MNLGLKKEKAKFLKVEKNASRCKLVTKISLLIKINISKNKLFIIH